MIASLQIIGKNRPENRLNELKKKIAAEKVIADSEQGKVEELKKLAAEYSQLEVKTQRVVKTIQSYGKKCKAAAGNFLKDGNVGNLLSELGKIKDAKTSLDETLENLTSIK